MPKIKNIIIFTIIAAIFIWIYIYFVKPDGEEEASLISTPSGVLPGVNNSGGTDPAKINQVIAEDFLSLLLNVKNIRLADSIFSDPAFQALQDSSIELVHDGTEGRPNPFARMGSDSSPVPPPSPLPPTSPEPELPPPAGENSGEPAI